MYLDRLILLYTEDSGMKPAVQSPRLRAGAKYGHQIDSPQDLLGSVILAAADVGLPFSGQRLFGARPIHIDTTQQPSSGKFLKPSALDDGV